jgi:hypothetical protein
VEEVYRKHWDAVGRPRKLSSGAMKRIMDQFAKGATIKELSQQYGVSTSLIRTITYHTPRDKDLHRMED